MFFEVFWNFLKYGAGFYALFLGIGIVKGEPIDTFTMPDGTVESGLVLEGAALVFLLVIIASAVVTAFFSFSEGYESRSRTKARTRQPAEETMEYVVGEIVEDELPALTVERPALNSKNTRRWFFLPSGRDKKDNGQ